MQPRATPWGCGMRVVRRGDRVAMLLNNRVEWLEVCIGAAAIGAVAAPFSTWSTRDCQPGPVARKCASTSGERRFTRVIGP